MKIGDCAHSETISVIFIFEPQYRLPEVPVGNQAWKRL
jgi:hypothetical protein